MGKENAEIQVIDRRTPVDVSMASESKLESSMNLVLAAINKGHAPEFIEKMMDLAERNQARIAREAFFEALAEFKAEAPPVKKDKHNKYFDSWYTSLGLLLQTYNPCLGKHGLSISFPSPEQTDKTMTIECRLAHRLGHIETLSITAPIDQAAIGKQSGQRSRNAIQDIRSTFTYLRSMTCEAILGVAGTEGTMDDDGNTAGTAPEYINEKQIKTITDYMNQFQVDEKKFLEYMGVESVETILAKDWNKAFNALEAKRKKAAEAKK